MPIWPCSMLTLWMPNRPTSFPLRKLAELRPWWLTALSSGAKGAPRAPVQAACCDTAANAVCSTVQTSQITASATVSTGRNGYALAVLWEWFAVSLFGLPALIVVSSSVLMLILAVATKPGTGHKAEEEYVSLVDRITNLALLHLLAQGLGWVLQRSM